MIRFILSTLALLATAFLAFIIEGGNPAALILPSPFIIVVCIPAFALLAVWSLKDWGRAWKDAFAKAGPSPSAATSAAIWDFFEKTCYIAGIVGFLLGLTIIFSSAYDPSKIIVSLGVDVIAPILAILFAMVARILRARVERTMS